MMVVQPHLKLKILITGAASSLSYFAGQWQHWQVVFGIEILITKPKKLLIGRKVKEMREREREIRGNERIHHIFSAKWETKQEVGEMCFRLLYRGLGTTLSVLSLREGSEDALKGQIRRKRNGRVWAMRECYHVWCSHIIIKIWGLHVHFILNGYLLLNNGGMVGKQMVDTFCNIPLSSMGLDDKLICKATADGKFRVKSVYSLEVNEKKREEGESSGCLNNKEVWRRIWELEVTNSVKTFLWSEQAVVSWLTQPSGYK